MSILYLLASSNFITVNKTLMKVVGLEASVLLGELASEYAYWEEQGILEDGFFYSTIENLEERTTLSVYKQQQAIQKLKELGLVETKLKGVPAKKYFRICEKQVLELFETKFAKNSQTGLREIPKLDCEKFAIKNNITNNKKEKEIKNNKGDTYDSILDSVPVILNNPPLRDAFLEFIKMRKVMKKPLTERALKLNIKEAYKLGNGDADQMQQIVEQSITHSWIGMFPLHDKNDGFGVKKGRRSGADAGIEYVGDTVTAGGLPEDTEDLFNLFGGEDDI